MNKVLFRYLRADVKKILLKIDYQTKGKIDISNIRELYFELGYITGRVDERIKDLIKTSTKKKDYVDILSELEKRRIKLEGLLDRYGHVPDETKNRMISGKYSCNLVNVNHNKVKM